MLQRHDDVGALLAQLGHVALGRLDRAFGAQLAFEKALVPIHDAGRGEADHADLHRHRHALAIRRGGGELLGDDGVRRHERLAALEAVHVGHHHREARAHALLAAVHALDIETAAEHLVEEVQAVVELVVAQRAGVVAGGVHHLVHRQRLRARDAADQRFVVGQRGALDGVAVVEQHRVRELLARGVDERCGALVAVRLVFGELEVVVAAHVEVQVGRFEQRDRGARAGGHGRRGGCGRRRRNDRGERGAASVATATGGEHGGQDGGTGGHGGEARKRRGHCVVHREVSLRI
ncbi:hypothetical protein D9M69_504670 [compost metagenome]